MNRIYFKDGENDQLTVTLTEGGNTVVWDKDRSRFFMVQIDPDTDADFYDADEAEEPSNALRPKPTPMPAAETVMPAADETVQSGGATQARDPVKKRLVAIGADHAYDAENNLWFRADPVDAPVFFHSRTGGTVLADAVEWVKDTDEPMSLGVSDSDGADSESVIFETTRGELKRLVASYLESATPAYADERGDSTGTEALFEHYWKRLKHLETVLGSDAMNEISQKLSDAFDERRRHPKIISVAYKGKWMTRQAFLDIVRTDVTPQLGTLDYIGDDEWQFTPNDGSEALFFDEGDLLEVGILRETRVGPNIEVDVDPDFPL